MLPLPQLVHHSPELHLKFFEANYFKSVTSEEFKKSVCTNSICKQLLTTNHKFTGLEIF